MNVEVVVPDGFVEAVAARAAAIVLDELDARQPAGVESEFVTVDEAAEILRSARQRVYDLCSNGRLTRVKDGSRTLLRRDEILAYLAGKSVAHALPTPQRNGTARRVAR